MFSGPGAFAHATISVGIAAIIPTVSVMILNHYANADIATVVGLAEMDIEER